MIFSTFTTSTFKDTHMLALDKFHKTSKSLLIAGLLVINLFTEVYSQQGGSAFLAPSFEYPALISAKETFSFVVNFAKLPGYKPAGQIEFTWPAGFRPFGTDNEFGKFRANGQKIIFSWEKMPEGGKFAVPYFVEAGEVKGGAYPVISEYADAIGLHIRTTSLITIMPGEVVYSPTGPVTDSLAKIGLMAEYPPEVGPKSQFPISFTMTKGKNVLPATLKINLPPLFQPILPTHLKHDLNREENVLTISWEQMPANPSFTIQFTIDVTGTQEASYPISAIFAINGDDKVQYNRYISVTSDKRNTKATESFPADKAVMVDTANIFSDLDKLLNKWMEVTSGAESPAKEPAQNLPAENKAVSASLSAMPVEQPAVVKGLSYRIQVFASTVKPANLRGNYMSKGIFDEIQEDFDGKTYRYTMGNFENQAKALEYLKELRSKGLTDAFIVKYVDGARQKP